MGSSELVQLDGEEEIKHILFRCNEISRQSCVVQPIRCGGKQCHAN
jgi:hypothetical protein